MQRRMFTHSTRIKICIFVNVANNTNPKTTDLRSRAGNVTTVKKGFDMSINNGGDTDYYKLPTEANMLQDMIEFKGMNFAQGNILKAIYRANDVHHSDYERDLNKIIWFATRELLRLEKDKTK